MHYGPETPTKLTPYCQPSNSIELRNFPADTGQGTSETWGWIETTEIWGGVHYDNSFEAPNELKTVSH